MHGRRIHPWWEFWSKSLSTVSFSLLLSQCRNITHQYVNRLDDVNKDLIRFVLDAL